MNEQRSCRTSSAYIFAGETISASRSVGIALFHPLVSCPENFQVGFAQRKLPGFGGAARLSILSTQSRNLAIDLESPPAAFLANCMVVACNEEIVRFLPPIIAVTGL